MHENIKILSPTKKNEIDDYFLFRWKNLRKPLSQPIGSERDNLEDESIHKMVVNDKNEIIAVGRLIITSKNTSQIRYFAVHKNHRRKGIGSFLMRELESIAKNNKCDSVMLNARENALKFYNSFYWHQTEYLNLLIPLRMK